MRTADTLHEFRDGCYCDRDWPASIGGPHTPYCRARMRGEGRWGPSPVEHVILTLNGEKTMASEAAVTIVFAKRPRQELTISVCHVCGGTHLSIELSGPHSCDLMENMGQVDVMIACRDCKAEALVAYVEVTSGHPVILEERRWLCGHQVKIEQCR